MSAELKNSPETGYTVALWSGESFDETQTLASNSPTARAILDAFALQPADEYILMQYSVEAGLAEVPLEGEISLQDTEIAKFFAFQTDRSYKISINDKRFSWGDDEISVPLIRLIGEIAENENVVLELREKADKVLAEHESVSLAGEQVEHVYSRPQEWRLNVQGVLITSPTPEIGVREALVQAGFDPNQCWTAILKVKGQPKRPVDLDSTIDLSEPGIEKLRLRPNEIKNGDSLQTLRKDFSLLEKDTHFLQKRGAVWETIVEGRRRWLLLRSVSLPDGYSETCVDIAMDVPSTYPAAAMDMFYCYPPVTLNSGKRPDRTEGTVVIEGKNYQQWSRHLNGATRWNPNTDSIISHIAFIEAAIGNEVGE